MALIDASQLDEIFAPSAPTSRDGNRRFLIEVDGTTIVIDSAILKVGQIEAPNLGPAAVEAAAVGFDSFDVPHSSPSVTSLNVGDALEETALGYLSRLPLAGGTMSGDIDFAGHTASGLADPVNPQDGVNLRTVEALVEDLQFLLPPTGFAGTAVPNGALKSTWVRATASVRFPANPTVGDTLTIHGVTLTFAAAAGPNQILIGLNPAATAANAVSEINANSTITLDGIPLNMNFFAIQDAGLGRALHLVVLNEDPPNTPEDGNLKQLSKVSVALTLRAFEGGLGSPPDGALVVDLFSNTLYAYDLMTPGWVQITGGGGGPVDATNVWYTGPAIPNVIGAVPDHLQNILISLNTNLGAGIIVPAPHAASHEDGGSDEIDVTDLSGLLADAQTPLSHATSHEDAGADEIDVTDLSGKLADPQNAGWLRGYEVDTAAPTDGYVLTWDNPSSKWTPKVASAGTDFTTITGVTDGEGSLAVGDVVYINASSQAKYADASGASTVPARGVVCAVGGGLVDVRVAGLVSGFAGLTPGATYYLDTTVGNLTATPPASPGDFIQIIGWAFSATVFVVDVKGAEEAAEVIP